MKIIRTSKLKLIKMRQVIIRKLNNKVKVQCRKEKANKKIFSLKIKEIQQIIIREEVKIKKNEQKKNNLIRKSLLLNFDSSISFFDFIN